MKTHLKLSIFILLIFSIGIANAGLIITTEDEGMTQTTIYQDGMMIHLNDNKQATMIIDSQKSQCTWFNHTSRKFAQGCSALSDSMNNIKAMGDAYMKTIMSQLSPEQQAMMKQEKENREQSLLRFQTKKIGTTNFQGFNVSKYHFFIEGSPFAEVWLSSDLQKALSKEVNLKVIDMLLFSDENEHASDSGHQDIQELLEQEIETMAKKENAYIIKQISQNNPLGIEIFGSQVIEIKTKKVDLNQYKPPSDYKEVGSLVELNGF